jgi:calcium release-activated calcium channel protein 1
MVEVALSNDLPVGLLIAYCICTTLVVAVHLLSLMISTCILPHLDAIIHMQQDTPNVDEAHERMQVYIELAWVFSTALGIILFLVQMALLIWVRFLPVNTIAPIVSSVIFIPVIVVFILFGIHFYRRLITHEYHRAAHEIEEMEAIAKELNTMSGSREFS